MSNQELLRGIPQICSTVSGQPGEKWTQVGSPGPRWKWDEVPASRGSLNKDNFFGFVFGFVLKGFPWSSLCFHPFPKRAYVLKYRSHFQVI